MSSSSETSHSYLILHKHTRVPIPSLTIISMMNRHFQLPMFSSFAPDIHFGLSVHIRGWATIWIVGAALLATACVLQHTQQSFPWGHLSCTSIFLEVASSPKVSIKNLRGPCFFIFVFSLLQFSEPPLFEAPEQVCKAKGRTWGQSSHEHYPLTQILAMLLKFSTQHGLCSCKELLKVLYSLRLHVLSFITAFKVCLVCTVHRLEFPL